MLFILFNAYALNMQCTFTTEMLDNDKHEYAIKIWCGEELCSALQVSTTNLLIPFN